MWSPDGNELFYVATAGADPPFVAVSVTTRPTFTFGNPVRVPRLFVERGPGFERNNDITRDGQRIPALAQSARAALDQAGIRNVSIFVGDGTLGWRPYAPYDAILVSAASPEIPQPLVDQLAPGGRMVVPIGDKRLQTLHVVRREGDEIKVSTAGDARFVPLLGQFGFKDS